MPTQKPRLAITLTPETREALERLTQVSGIASSQFVSQMLHDAIPMIDAMTRSFEAAKKSPHRAAEIMQELLTEAQVEVAQHQLAFDAAAKKKKRKLRKRPKRD